MFARERRALTGDVSALLDRETADQLNTWRLWIADLLSGGGFRTLMLCGVVGCLLLAILVSSVVWCCKVKLSQFKQTILSQLRAGMLLYNFWVRQEFKEWQFLSVCHFGDSLNI